MATVRDRGRIAGMSRGRVIAMVAIVAVALPLLRPAVRNLLTRSESYRSLR